MSAVVPAPLRLTFPTMGSNTHTVQRFRPRATVEAIRYDGTNTDTITEWSGARIRTTPFGDTDLWLIRETGSDRVSLGDWVIRGTTGRFFSVSAKQFELDYTPEPSQPEPTPAQRVGEAQLRVMAAQRAAAKAQSELATAQREADQAARDAQRAIEDAETGIAEQMASFDQFEAVASKLSPNAQQFVSRRR